MERDLNQDVKINRFKLEEECEMHPSIYNYYSELEAEQISKINKLELKLKFISGEVELELRKKPPEDMKVTNDTIKALLATNKKINDLEMQIANENTILLHLKSAVKSLEHKKSELNNLVSLYQSQYFSKPTGHRKDTNEDNYRKDVKQNLGRRE